MPRSVFIGLYGLPSLRRQWQRSLSGFGGLGCIAGGRARPGSPSKWELSDGVFSSATTRR